MARHLLPALELMAHGWARIAAPHILLCRSIRESINCASRQSAARSEKQDVGKATVHAEAGQVYYYVFKIDRIEIGIRRTADGGGAGMGGSLPNTPDMTARDLPTTDSVDFTTLTEDEGKSLVKIAAVSTSVPKH